jgi:hypothetical protein
MIRRLGPAGDHLEPASRRFDAVQNNADLHPTTMPGSAMANIDQLALLNRGARANLPSRS